MARRSYGYRPRRSRHRRREWLLLIPLAIVAAVVYLASGLPHGNGELLSVTSTCPAGEGCSPVISAPAGCASGGACLPSREQPFSSLAGEPPAVTAAAVAVLEEPCGALLYGENVHQRLPPASLTKLVTALVALEHANLSDTVNVRVDGAELAAATDSTVMGLEPGQQVSLRDLLYGLLLPSGNDAALAIAEHVAFSTDSFVDLMNDEVAQLGLTDTHFTNPHGLHDPELYTSAYDIATIGWEVIRRPELADIVRTRTYQPAWDGPALWNGNRLVYSYPGSLGVKIGYTDEAKQTIVAAAERSGRRVIVSALGSSSVYEDAVALLDWAFAGEESACQQPSVGFPAAAPAAGAAAATP